jgi:hypothetical protein
MDILLKDYVIDTKGVMPPEEVWSIKKVWNSRLKRIIELGEAKSWYFKDIDGRGIYYKINPDTIPNPMALEDCYLLSKALRILYT